MGLLHLIEGYKEAKRTLYKELWKGQQGPQSIDKRSRKPPQVSVHI